MLPSETISETILWGSVLGGPALGRVTADVQLSGYINGAASTLTPTLTDIGTTADGRFRAYKLSYALPATPGIFRRYIGSRFPLDIIQSNNLYGEVESYDLDSLAGLLLTSTGTPGVQSAADGDLGDIVMGDAFASAVTTIPLGKISNFGYSDLTGMTITAGVKVLPTDTAIILSSPGAAIVSAAARTVTFGWNTWPGGILDLSGTETTKQAYLDVQLKHTVSGRIITGLRYGFTVQWQRDTTL